MSNPHTGLRPSPQKVETVKARASPVLADGCDIGAFPAAPVGHAAARPGAAASSFGHRRHGVGASVGSAVGSSVGGSV